MRDHLDDIIVHYNYILFLPFLNDFFVVLFLQDLLYPRESHKNIEEIRLTYCLHAVNHVLK